MAGFRHWRFVVRVLAGWGSSRVKSLPRRLREAALDYHQTARNRGRIGAIGDLIFGKLHRDFAVFGLKNVVRGPSFEGVFRGKILCARAAETGRKCIGEGEFQALLGLF